MVDDPDETHLQSEKKPANHTNSGYTTEEALKVLCHEIDETVKWYETDFRRER